MYTSGKQQLLATTLYSSKHNTSTFETLVRQECNSENRRANVDRHRCVGRSESFLRFYANESKSGAAVLVQELHVSGWQYECVLSGR